MRVMQEVFTNWLVLFRISGLFMLILPEIKKSKWRKLWTSKQKLLLAPNTQRKCLNRIKILSVATQIEIYAWTFWDIVFSHYPHHTIHHHQSSPVFQLRYQTRLIQHNTWPCVMATHLPVNIPLLKKASNKETGQIRQDNGLLSTFNTSMP